MREKVFEIVASVMGVPVETISLESSPDTIEAWDSLNHMNLLLALEQEFGVQFSDEQMVELLSVEIILATLDEIGRG